MAESVDIVVRTTGADTAASQFNKLSDAADKSAGSVQKVQTQSDALTNALGFLQGALLAIGAGELIRGYTDLADTFQGIVSRLKLVTTNADELVATEQKLLDVANETRGSFEGTANLYTKLASQTSQLGIDQKDLIPAITTVNQLIAISGATATEAKAGLLQFSQGLASNRFQGDELRSVLENLPALGQAIAKGLGTTTAGLRAMGKEGQLTTKLVLDALAKSAPEIAKQFQAITPTIGQAFQVLKNNVLQMVGVFDQVNSVGNRFASVILFVANNIQNFVKAIGVAIFTMGAFYAGLYIESAWAAFGAAVASANARLLAYVVAAEAAGVQTTILQRIMVTFAPIINGTTGLLRTLWAVMAANPITAIITILAAAAAAVYMFGNQIKLTSNGSITLLGALVGSFNFLLAKLQAVWSFVINFFAPAFRFVGTVVSETFQLILDGAQKVVDFLAQFIPSLTGISDTVKAWSADWVKAMQDASKATEDTTLKAKDFGKGFKDAADTITGQGGVVPALQKLTEEERRASTALADYNKLVQKNNEELARTALLTRNAFGEMVEAVDEWARRSGAAFNSVKEQAASMASSVSDDLSSATSSASSFGGGVSGVSGGGSGGGSSGEFSFIPNSSDNSVYFNDPQTVKLAFEAQGGRDWGGVFQALKKFDTFLGKPGGDTALLGLYQKLQAEPKEAAHAFVQNYGYVNGYLQGMGLPGFATGGDFTVGGSGGTDSQLVQFMASPEEKVLVETPAQRRQRLAAQDGSARQQRNVIVNMNVTTPDANSFRRSKNQTYLALQAKLAGAIR